MSLRTCCKSGLPIIGGGNRILKDNVRFFARRIAANNVVTDTYVTPNWNGFLYEEPADIFDRTNERFVCPATGMYAFSGAAELTMPAAGTAQISFLFNGSMCSGSDTTGFATTIYPSHSFSVWLEKDDLVQYRVYQNSGSTAVIVGSDYNTFFCGTSIFLE
jgi:hypothetical protein